MFYVIGTLIGQSEPKEENIVKKVIFGSRRAIPKIYFLHVRRALGTSLPGLIAR